MKISLALVLLSWNIHIALGAWWYSRTDEPSNVADSVETDTSATGLIIGKRGIQWRESFELGLVSVRKFVQITGAFSSPGIEGAPKLSPASAGELYVGIERQHPIKGTNAVARLEGSSLSVGHLSPSLGFTNSEPIATEGWRFGFRLASGHRYSPNESGLYLLHTGGWTWSYIRPYRTILDTTVGQSIDGYNDVDGFRTSHFGANTGAWIGYQFGHVVGFKLGYQRVLLYKNHTFFPWLGSLLLEGLAQSIMKGFLQSSEHRSPTTLPIATLILRSVLSWGIYELRRTSGQHFPFGGNTPMLWDEFHAGVLVNF